MRPNQKRYLGHVNPARELIRQLADEALNFRMCMSVRFPSKPGDVILNLPPEQRAALANLKPEDLMNDRWPNGVWSGMNLEKLPTCGSRSLYDLDYDRTSPPLAPRP